MRWRRVGPVWWKFTDGFYEAIDELEKVLWRTEHDVRVRVYPLGLRDYVFPGLAIIRWHETPRFREPWEERTAA